MGIGWWQGPGQRCMARPKRRVSSFGPMVLKLVTTLTTQYILDTSLRTVTKYYVITFYHYNLVQNNISCLCSTILRYDTMAHYRSYRGCCGLLWLKIKVCWWIQLASDEEDRLLSRLCISHTKRTYRPLNWLQADTWARAIQNTLDSYYTTPYLAESPY